MSFSTPCGLLRSTAAALGLSASEQADGVDHHPLMGALANLLVRIEGLDVEDQAAAIDLDELSAGANELAGWARGQMPNVDANSNGGLTGRQQGLYRRAGSVFHQGDERRGRKDIQAA